VPRRHFRLRAPASLAPQEAQQIYEVALNALSAGYARSGDPSAESYSNWRRYNSAPYLSSTHGNHYVNNYANETARAYGSGKRLPLGSVIAKDSFSVTETGGILLGPLFLMEKMPEGFSYVSGDWKYSLIQPDGTPFGETHGAGSQRVQYCIRCHLAVEAQDHLYFVPPEHRAKNTN
ncbi:MAG TPA: cytochrome P460 family protein, partial [Gammaproteobacteria bacterium]|nr:cytochrome P460 family protein [Gammaproteobacteria bacterium]